MWKTVDYYCFQAKNVYNAANYVVRQEFINNGKWIRYYELDRTMRDNLIYYELGSQASQMVLRLLDKNWKSFFNGIKLYSKGNKNNFLGKPNLPKYKNQNGRSALMLTNNLFKIKNDPRKTLVGDFLRKTNIDELPQLINILIGDMSLVGPRPHMIKQTEEFYQIYDKYLVRHWVKPGLTGWAQVNGWRGDSDIGMRVKYDIDYIENWTFFLDIKIILLTIVSNKVRKHAY